MSALDMVLQRQVPARSAAKTGEGAIGSEAGGDARNNAFSAALSNEKRNASSERDKVQSRSPTDTGADTDTEGSVDQVVPETGQSDEILNLLSGLMSSAAYSDDVDLGRDEAADPQMPDAGTPEAKATTENDDIAGDTTVDVPVTPILLKPGAVTADEVDAVQTNPTGKASGNKDLRAEVKQVSADMAQPTPGATPADGTKASENKTGQLSASVGSAEAAPAAQASAAAAGMTAQATQAPAKPTAAGAGSDRQKDTSAIKEALRALGLEREPQAAESEAAKTSVRGRSARKQGGIPDRQVDEHAGLKQGKVEVIESRRFMPVQNMSANAQSLTRSLAEVGGAALAAQRAAPAQSIAQTGLAQNGLAQTGQTLHTLKLQLNPVSLGSITAVLKLSGEELSVEIKVETAEAYRQLKDDNQSILKALRGQGFGVEQITVQHVAGPDRSSSQTSQQGFQPNQQGAGSNDAQSSGRESGRDSAGQQGANQQGTQGHEQSSHVGPGAGRTDGVYL